MKISLKSTALLLIAGAFMFTANIYAAKQIEKQEETAIEIQGAEQKQAEEIKKMKAVAEISEKEKLIQPAGAGVVQLVVRVGEFSDGDAFAMTGGVNKFVPSGIDAHMRYPMLIGVLKKDKIPSP